MADIHLLGIKFIEQNTQDGLDFKYKPDVPKLKVIGTILIAAEEEEDNGCVFLTQKQLNLADPSNFHEYIISYNSIIIEDNKINMNMNSKKNLININKNE